MKKLDRAVALSMLLAAISFAAYLLVYFTLPDIVPLHWNWNGEVDGWGPKITTLAVAAVPLGVPLLMHALVKFDPRRENHKRHTRAYRIITLALTVLLIFPCWLTVIQLHGFDMPVARLLPALVGATFVVLGNYMPQIKSNYFMGFRTPWALQNDFVWQKTHRAGGLLFVVCGALMVIGSLLPLSPLSLIGPIALLLAGVVAVFIYSYWVYKKLDDTDTKKETHHAED